jgi:hypothetical protein
MRNFKLLSCLMLLAGISISNVALADHGYGGRGGHGGWHSNFGIYLGGPVIYPSPYYYPYGYYPPTIVVPTQPQVYIEQGDAQVAPAPAPAPAAPSSYWYYCDKAQGYYPYVKECPAGWQKVSPTPPQEQ